MAWSPGLRRLLDCHCAVVATSKKNACVSLVFSFLYKVVQVGPVLGRPPGEGSGIVALCARGPGPASLSVLAGESP